LGPAVAVGLARENKGIEENWPTGVSTKVEDMGRKTTWASVRLMMLRVSDRETRQILYADQVDRYPRAIHTRAGMGRPGSPDCGFL
jgi:hypothetical protein